MKKLFFILLLPVCAKAQLASLIVRNDTLFSFNPSTNEWRQLTKTVPPQSGQSGKVVSTNGSTYQWSSVNDLIGYTPVSVTRLTDTASAIRASIPSTSGFATTTRLSDSAVAIRSAIPSVAGKLNISDTAGMLSGYSRTTHTHTGVYQPAGSYLVAADIAGKANIAAPAFTGAVTTTGSIGYATGAGGTVTQATSKSTGVTLNKITGEITLNGAALAAATIVSFTLTNSTIAATDVMILNHVTTGTRGGYTLNAQCAAGSAVIYVRNNTAGSLSEAIVIRFAVVKGVTN